MRKMSKGKKSEIKGGGDEKRNGRREIILIFISERPRITTVMLKRSVVAILRVGHCRYFFSPSAHLSLSLSLSHGRVARRRRREGEREKEKRERGGRGRGQGGKNTEAYSGDGMDSNLRKGSTT